MQIESNYFAFTCFDKMNTSFGLSEFVFNAWFYEWLYASFYKSYCSEASKMSTE